MAEAQSATKTPETPPLPQFTCFPQLHVELQLRIWDFVLPRPQVVEIRYDEETNEFYSDLSVPVILHICKRSREHGLKQLQQIVVSNTHEEQYVNVDWEDSDSDGDSNDDDDDDSGDDESIEEGNTLGNEHSSTESPSNELKDISSNLNLYVDYLYDKIYVSTSAARSKRYSQWVVEAFNKRRGGNNLLSRPTQTLAMTSKCFTLRFIEKLLKVVQPPLRELYAVIYDPMYMESHLVEQMSIDTSLAKSCRRKLCTKIIKANTVLEENASEVAWLDLSLISNYRDVDMCERMEELTKNLQGLAEDAKDGSLDCVRTLKIFAVNIKRELESPSDGECILAATPIGHSESA